MFLLLDPSEKDTIRLVLFDTKHTWEKKVAAQNREMLVLLDSFLKEKKMSPADIGGIAVVVGAGSFTSTRIATTIANTFAYVQQAPLLAVSLEESKEPKKLVTKIEQQPKGQYISATYSAEANIGKKKPENT